MDEETKGFIILPRCLRDRASWKKKPFDEDRALIDLLCDVTFKKRKVEGVTLLPGQILVKKKACAKKWGWSRMKVQRFFKKLQKERGEIWAIVQEIVSISSSNPIDKPRTIGTRVEFIYWDKWGRKK